MSRQRKNRRPWAWVTAIPWPLWLSLALAAGAAFVATLLAGRGTAALLLLFVTYVCTGGYADSLRARRVVRHRSARKTGRATGAEGARK